jgi:hypothetical protein
MKVYQISPITKMSLRNLPVPAGLSEVVISQDNGTERDYKYTLFLTEQEVSNLAKSLLDHIDYYV